MPYLTPTEDALPPEDPAIWVQSDLLPDGTYVTAMYRPSPTPLIPSSQEAC